MPGVDVTKPVVCLNCGLNYPSCMCDGDPYWGNEDREQDRL